MPWSGKDALKHSKKASTPEKQHKWNTIANKVLKTSGDEGRAIRIANSQMAKGGAVDQPFLPIRDLRYASRGNTFGQSVSKTSGAPRQKFAKGGSVGGKKKWIQGMHMKKGALHEQMGVPKDQPIPPARLEAASHSSNPQLRRRANLAKTLKGLPHKGAKRHACGGKVHYSHGGSVSRADGCVTRGHTKGRIT